MRDTKLVRDVTLLLLGIVGFIYEMLSGLERPTFLALVAACLGLPLFLRKDERRQEAER